MTFQSTWTGILYDVPDPTFPKYVARCARMVYIAEAMAASGTSPAATAA